MSLWLLIFPSSSKESNQSVPVSGSPRTDLEVIIIWGHGTSGWAGAAVSAAADDIRSYTIKIHY
jgi:hypothetical protein